jgi:hypothetical protein
VNEGGRSYRMMVEEGRGNEGRGNEGGKKMRKWRREKVKGMKMEGG